MLGTRVGLVDDQRFVDQVGQFQRPGELGQPVLGMQHHLHLGLIDRLLVNIGGQLQVVDESNVDLALAQGRQQVLVGAHAHIELHLGVVEPFQRGRNQVRRERSEAAEAHRPAQRSFGLRECCTQFADIGEESPGHGGEVLPGRGEPDPVGLAAQAQGLPGMLLDGGNCLRQGRFRDSQFTGRRTERAVDGQFSHDFQMAHRIHKPTFRSIADI